MRDSTESIREDRLNAAYRLNAALKYAVQPRTTAATKAMLESAATEHMHRLEQAPQRIGNYSLDPRVSFDRMKGRCVRWPIR